MTRYQSRRFAALSLGLLGAVGGAGAAAWLLSLPGVAAAGLGAVAAIGAIRLDRRDAARRLDALRETRRVLRAQRKPPEPIDPITAAAPLLDGLPFELAVLDGRGVVLFANAAMREAVGRDIAGELFSATFRSPALLAALQDAGSEGSAAAVSFTARRPQERHLEALIRPLAPISAEGEPELAPRLAVALIDQTAMRRAERLHRDFVANASHELKTPLAAISGFIETIQGPARDDAPARDRFLGLMAEQAARMARLVQDLLSLNRIELNEHVAPEAPVDLTAVVGSARAAALEVEVALDAPADSPWVCGDVRDIEQALVNLLENALQHGVGARPPRLFITDALGKPGYVGVGVQDFGPGIAKEHLPRLTERFYRVGGSRAGGTGLGLSIVRQVALRHRGLLEVESKLGVGSRFTLWLPIHRGSDQASNVMKSIQLRVGAAADPASR